MSYALSNWDAILTLTRQYLQMTSAAVAIAAAIALLSRVALGCAPLPAGAGVEDAERDLRSF